MDDIWFDVISAANRPEEDENDDVVGESDEVAEKLCDDSQIGIKEKKSFLTDRLVVGEKNASTYLSSSASNSKNCDRISPTLVHILSHPPNDTIKFPQGMSQTQEHFDSPNMQSCQYGLLNSRECVEYPNQGDVNNGSDDEREKQEDVTDVDIFEDETSVIVQDTDDGM